jgi:hypothetical protein
LNLLQENTIIVVDNAIDLSVTGIRLHGHELLGKLLVEIDLAGLDDTAVVDCAVLGDGPVGVDLDVDVEGSADLDGFYVSEEALPLRVVGWMCHVRRSLGQYC